jgi:uncharacterized membrane protein
LDGKRFQELLPYALALDVEDAWTQRFIDAVGLAAATQSMKDVSWSPTSDIHVLGKEISDSLLPALNNSTAPESSSSGGSFGSSGGGGGGFSGGGGGGGGGGGR